MSLILDCRESANYSTETSDPFSRESSLHGNFTFIIIYFEHIHTVEKY